MPSGIWWNLFGLPFAATLVTWVSLIHRWTTESNRMVSVLATTLASAASLYACLSFAFVQFVAPEPTGDYTMETRGLLLSFLGIVAGFMKGRPRRWYSRVAIRSSAWMFVLFFLMCSTF